ncbi:MAG: hypothetical protein QGH60_21470 [Phycisphaerae bacterium]|jgi:hypothetical protein|nr:hypothetical protein [Phycisphaerae bacterium]
MKNRRRIPLCIPPLILCLIDQTITLIGQTPAYWSGDYSNAREGNPLFNWLLCRHPLAFEAGVLLWIAIFGCAILFLPRFVSKVVSVAVVLGHTWGAASWLCLIYAHGYWYAIGLCLLSGIAVNVSWEMFHKNDSVRYSDNKTLQRTRKDGAGDP